MKKIFISVLSLTILSGITQRSTAQEDKIKDNKQEEIIIRKNGDKDTKVTVEMKGDDILINGKPLSEFKDDDVTVIKRKKITHNGNDFLTRPHGGNSIYLNDDDDGEETRPFLGVSTDRDDKGVKITGVSKGSAAEKAGLKEGDLITKIGDKKITDPEELTDVVKSYKPKDEVKIYYERNGKSNETKAILGERKQSIARSFFYNNDEVPHMNPKMFKDFNFQMPPMETMPGQPFNKFWMGPNKKLGVKIEDTENDGGVKITNVEEGSVAEKAGLKKDDIITEVDGGKIENVDDAREKILQNDKTNYTIKAKRNGTDMNFEIKIPKKTNSADL
jgi:serine protease Do